MDPQFYELIEQAWSTLLIVIVPSLAIPAASIVASVLLGMIGVRDEGVGYAVRVLAMVAVAALTVPESIERFKSLMSAGLS
jgi:type III secretory pathway component EscS